MWRCLRADRCVTRNHVHPALCHLIPSQLVWVELNWTGSWILSNWVQFKWNKAWEKVMIVDDLCPIHTARLVSTKPSTGAVWRKDSSSTCSPPSRLLQNDARLSWPSWLGRPSQYDRRYRYAKRPIIFDTDASRSCGVRPSDLHRHTWLGRIRRDCIQVHAVYRYIQVYPGAQL